MYDVEQKKAKPIARILIDAFAIAVIACAWLFRAPRMPVLLLAAWCLAGACIAMALREAWRFLYAAKRLGPVACVRILSLCFLQKKPRRLCLMPGWTGFSFTYARFIGNGTPEAMLLAGSLGNALFAMACAGLALVVPGSLPMVFFAAFFATCLHPLIPSCTLAPNEALMLAQCKKNPSCKKTWKTLMGILVDMMDGMKLSDIDYRAFITEERSMPAAAIRLLNAMRIEEFNALDQAYKTYEAVLRDPNGFPLICIIAKCRMRCIARILPYLDAIPFAPKEEKAIDSRLKGHPSVILMKWMEGDPAMEKKFNKAAARYIFPSQVEECKRLKAQQP